jgi:hypothetical protein
MRHGLRLLAALLIPLGAAEAKINISRYATLCLINLNRDHCLCDGFYRDLGNGNCECRHASGRIVRRKRDHRSALQMMTFERRA